MFRFVTFLFLFLCEYAAHIQSILAMRRAKNCMEDTRSYDMYLKQLIRLGVFEFC